MTSLKHLARRAFGLSAGQGPGVKDIYQACLTSLLSCQESVSVAVIGANDGRINDPFFDLARRFPDRTDVLLVEPQAALLPYLSENYAFHPRHQIVQGAIGSGDSLTLYAVKEEYWPVMAPPYAAGWPAYRASTGITSSSRQQVADWVARWSDVPPETAIKQIQVPCRTLEDVLFTHDRKPVVDVLQIDAEGADDLVLYACSVAKTRPRLIYLETKSLPPGRLRDLSRFLETAGYDLRTGGGDTLAVSTLFRGS